MSNTQYAIAILDGLVAAGIRRAIICPGSRSTPLALAAESHPDVTTHVCIDERSAGFFALGIAKASGRPACVITTSGTAVANLSPSAAEGHNGNTPVVYVTADRPRRLWDTGANQTLDQADLFSRFCRATATLGTDDKVAPRDLESQVKALAAKATTFPAGPVHIDVPLEKPLEPDAAEQRMLQDLETRDPATGSTPKGPSRPPHGRDDFEPRAAGPRGLIVVGPRADASLAIPLQRLAERLQVPLIADGLSSCRGEETQCHADLYLHDETLRKALAPDWILQFGASPTSKAVREALASWDAPRIKVDESGRGWNDIPGDVRIITLDPVHWCSELAQAEAPDADPTWRARWLAIDDAAKVSLQTAMADEEAAELEPQWVAAVMQHTRTLFVGNSMPVRDLDALRRPADADIHASRGASGIDGTLATACGIAAATAGPVHAVIGDVAFQHDLGSLALMPDNLRLIVINNGGGRIFHHLPVSHSTPHFDKLFLTPPQADIRQACAAFGIEAMSATPSTLAAALEAGAQVIELSCDGQKSAAFRSRLRPRVMKAILDAGLTG